MRYMMKSGILSNFDNEKKLAQIKSEFWGAKKTITLSDSDSLYQTNIDIMSAPLERSGDVRYRVYILTNENDEVLLKGHPGYALEDDPDVVGWPVYRAPKVDHADVLIDGFNYLLVMNNSQNYVLKNDSGASVLQIMHQGISGGWIIETNETFDAPILCGLFIFCRYIEQENEFSVV